MPGKLDIRDAFEVVHGLPRPNWKVLRERLCQITGKPEPRDEDWCKVQRHWLKMLAATAGEKFGVIESDRFMLMTRGADEAQWILELAEQAQEKVMGALGDRPGGRMIGKIPILSFMAESLYRQHCRHYRMEGGQGQSDGCCIRDDGEIHIALPALRETKTVLPHELVHAHLGRLMLPTWLDEGVAQIVARRWKYDITTELASHAKLYWRTRGLERFWSAEAFAIPRNDEEQWFAYMFAEQLVKEMKGASEDDFRKFLETAHLKDAGAEACRKVYGFGLGGWVERLIGKGDWNPSVDEVKEEEYVELEEAEEESDSQEFLT